jgi:3-methyl-2-oxobutanoate hydroxymethyltransferase
VLVINDAIGLGDYWPPFSRQYAYVGKTIVEVAQAFQQEVKDGTFVNQVRRMQGRKGD